jgi:sarcosine oxidase subunit beta
VPEDLVEPDACPVQPRAESIERFASWATHRFPALARAAYRGGYAAFYDVSPDAQFILDGLPVVAGAFVALGFSGHGFKHSPMIGRLMADLVLKGPGETGVDPVLRSSRWRGSTRTRKVTSRPSATPVGVTR